MKNAIQKLFIGKMLGLDKILNKAIKVALEKLATPFANAIIVCF